MGQLYGKSEGQDATPTRWRTAALLGARTELADLVEALATVAYARGVRTPTDVAWDPLDAAALWLHGVASTPIDGRPWGWTLLRPREEPGPLRRLQELPIDVVCAVHPAGAAWTPELARGWAEAGVTFVVIDDGLHADEERTAEARAKPTAKPGFAAPTPARAKASVKAEALAEDVRRRLRAVIGREVQVFSCALSRAGVEATLWEWAPEAADGPPLLEALVAAWDAVPGDGRALPEIRPGRRLLCTACRAPVTEPVLLVSAEENAAVLAHDRLSRGNEWIGPGLCLAAFSTDARDTYWFVEPVEGPVTRCPNGHEVGHRTTHLTGGQGELDGRYWRVAALRRDRVVWEG